MSGFFNLNVSSPTVSYFRAQLERIGPTWYLSPWWRIDSTTAKQNSLFQLLSIAHTERLDHVSLIDSFAREHRGWYRRRLMQLAKRLRTGCPMIVAIEQTPEVLSDDQVLALRFASQSGSLSQTFHQLVHTEDSQQDETKAAWQSLFVYWGVTLLVLVSITLWMMIRIAPTHSQILKEFEMQRQSPFFFLKSSFDLLSDNIPVALAVAFVIAFLFFSSTSRRFFRRVVAPHLTIAPNTSRSSFMLRLLSISTNAGRPLPGTLSTLAKYHYDKKVRQRLLVARNEMEQGVNDWQSLSDAELITTAEAKALVASPDNQSRAWLLERLALAKTDRACRSSSTMLAFAHPVAILIFGCFVLFIFIAFFGMNLELIYSLG